MTLFYAKNAAEGVTRAKVLAETPDTKVGVFTPLGRDFHKLDVPQNSGWCQVTQPNGSTIAYYSGGLDGKARGARYDHIILCNYRGMSVGDYQDIVQSACITQTTESHPEVCENSRDCIVCEKPIENGMGVCFADHTDRMDAALKERALVLQPVQTAREKLASLKGAVDERNTSRIDFKARRGSDGVGIDGQPTVTFYFDKDGKLDDVWVYA